MAGEEEEEEEEVINEAAIITGACLRQLLEDSAHTRTHTHKLHSPFRRR